MKNKTLLCMVVLSFFSINLFSQGLLNELSPERATKIRELITEFELSEKKAYDADQSYTIEEEKSSVDSDNWQVVRILAVCSETTDWDIIGQYDSSTSSDHGGAWLLVVTEEEAFEPLLGIIDVEAQFRYYSATELVNYRVDISDGIYTGYRRYWYVERNITYGDFEFTADYVSSVGTSYLQVHLHKDIYVR